MDLASFSNPRRRTVSKFNGIQGPGDGSSFMSAYVGSNSKDANTFPPIPDVKISKSPGINSSVMQMDKSSLSSNIELKLGHASQRNKKLGFLAQQAFECYPMVKPTENRQSLFPELSMHKVESRAMEQSKSKYHMFNMSPRSGKGQLDLVNSAYGVNNATSESRTRNIVLPTRQPLLNGPSEGILFSEASKNRVNGNYIPPEEPQCESHALKCDQIDYNHARGNITNREFNIDTSCAFGHGNNGKDVGDNIVNLHTTTEVNFGLYSKDYENKRTVQSSVEGIGHSNCLALHDKNLFSCKQYGMMDMPDAKNSLNLYGKTSLISHNGPFDDGNVRSVCEPMDARAASAMQADPLRFSLSSSTLIRNPNPRSSKGENLNARQVELTENPRTQTLHHGLKFSIPAPLSFSTAATREPFDKAPTSTNQLYESNVANTLTASKIAAVSGFSGVSDCMGKHFQAISPITDQVKGCHISSLSHGGSLCPHHLQLHCQLSTDFNAVYWPYARHGCFESNITPSIEQAKCFPNSFMSSHCNCAVKPDTSVEKHHFFGEPLHITPREQKGISGCIEKNISACKLGEGDKFASKNARILGKNSDLMGPKRNNTEYHFSQWRDVPKKTRGAVTLTCMEQTTRFLNVNNKLRERSADAGGNKPCCDVALQCLKEPEMSYASSGGSAPVVTEASAVIHDRDISTADGQNVVASNVVVDEGSGIDRCWSSNDAQCSEQSAEFFSVASGFNPMDAGPSKRFADNFSRSLIDELRLRDSLRLKKMQNQSSFSIQEKSHCVQKMTDISKKVIRKKTKRRKLDTTFPASAFYSACGYPGSTRSAELQCSCKDKGPLSGSSGAQECACSIEPSSRGTRFRMHSSRTTCNCNINSDEAKTIGMQSKVFKDGDGETFEACELPRRKRPKLDTASSSRQMDAGNELGDAAAGKCSLVDSTTSFEMHEKVSRRAVRPMVCGKYGVISNGNPSNPVKFVSLKKICDSLAKCSPTGNCITKSTSVKYRKVSAKEKNRRINKSANLKKGRIRNADRGVTARKSTSHLVTSSELVPCRSSEQSKRTHSHVAEQGSHIFYSLRKRRYDYLVKTGTIADGPLPTEQKPKSKEIQERSLYELTLEGIHPEEALTCARTEGYKGRKKEGVRYNFPQHSEPGGGCVVTQEQLNAWTHITGQKSSRKEIPRLPPKDAEYDYRKEYARYKHSKGWKSLVVYKSGIHALGLYTSRFISPGEMVVEYVGEIVGLRVSDKREHEYLSGKKLQYKSACYFFRIDQEHIVDATQKGGIARFVNHSCQPNCVARIISVRNEKKVVFFADRDIYPGEEITYDYNFNHEDEGKKIPCYCNSRKCRQYLN